MKKQNLKKPDPLKDINFFNGILKEVSTLIQAKTLDKLEDYFQFYGVKLFTDLLPAVGKVIDYGTKGTYIGDKWPHELKLKKGYEYPILLQEFWRVLCPDGYFIVDTPSIYYREIRQICFLFKKLEMPYNDLDSYIQDFVDFDLSLPCAINTSITLKERIESILPPDPYNQIIPRHSNGATASKGISNDMKLRIKRFMPLIGLEKLYHNRDHFVHSKKKMNRYMSLLQKHNKGKFDFGLKDIPAKITAVPKDSGGPRLICMMPHERTYVQQGIMHYLYGHIESLDIGIRFTDQTANQKLAYLGSLTGEWATIDMKNASDSVSLTHITELFPMEWQELLLNTRSRSVLLPNGKKHILRKYAPMGDSTTFPIEAIVFWAIAREVSDVVHIFGDDIIVPKSKYNKVISELTKYGLIVNTDKSFGTGFFRESCGGDYFKGMNVTPVRLKRLDIRSICDFVSHFDSRPLYTHLRKYFNRLEVLPRANRDSAAIACYLSDYRIKDSFSRKIRFNKDLQVIEYRVLLLKNESTEYRVKGWDRLMYNLTPNEFSMFNYEHANSIKTYNSKTESSENKDLSFREQMLEIANVTERRVPVAVQSRIGYGWVSHLHAITVPTILNKRLFSNILVERDSSSLTNREEFFSR